MSDEVPRTESDEHQRVRQLLTSRRRFLEAAGAAGLLAGGGLAFGQQTETTYEFGGEVAGWQGQAPDEIADETNLTLELEAGTDYEVVGENLDGQPHDFVIQDENGEELVGTDIYDEQGETESLTFTASEEMDQYICTVHPSSMVGDVQIGESEESDDEEVEEVDGFVPEGPTVGVEQVADGPLVNPVTLRTVPGEEDTHLVVDQSGTIYSLQNDELQDEPFLDISDDVLRSRRPRAASTARPGSTSGACSAWISIPNSGRTDGSTSATVRGTPSTATI